MRRVVIVQARMGSSRLPGKVLSDLGGQPMLAQQLRKLKLCRNVDEIVVATTVEPADDRIVALADVEAVRWYRGSEHDVLDRYVRASQDSRAELVVRITADCPLIDPEQTDRVISELETNRSHADYAANFIQRTYPQGLDAEALFHDTLERVNRLAASPRAREHVTRFIYRERPDLFVILSITDLQDNSDLRWTVDTQEDLELVRQIYSELGLGYRVLPYPKILEHVRRNSALLGISAHRVERTPSK